MSIRQAQRGAVHVMWLILVLIVALLFAVLWFARGGETDRANAAAKKAQADLKPLEYRLDYARKAYKEVASLLGGGIPVDLAIPETVDTDPSVAPADDKAMGNALKKFQLEMRDQLSKAGDAASAAKTAKCWP